MEKINFSKKFDVNLQKTRILYLFNWPQMLKRHFLPQSVECEWFDNVEHVGSDRTNNPKPVRE